MKRNKHGDIIFLLAGLLFLSGSVSFLCAQNEKALSDKEVLAEISPLLIAHDENNISNFLATLNNAQQISIIKQLLQDHKKHLSTQGRIGVILGVALRTSDIAHKKELLKIAIEDKNLVNHIPLFFVAKATFSELIPLFIETAATDKASQTKLFTDAIDYAISHDKPPIVNRLLMTSIKPSAVQLTGWLWRVVQENKDAAFIPLLVSPGAQVNDAQKGKTPLITAVENNNQEQVLALLKHGAAINFIADPVVGSALQIAIKNGYTDLELLLRKHGARE